MTLQTLQLKKHEERRLLTGHLWVYSNEVDVAKTPLTTFAPGEQVILQTAGGKILGCGYVNPQSLICVRLISHDPNQILDKSLLRKRIKQALALRERLFSHPFYRLVFGESDGLPGLVVDRYGDVLVVQINTAGMEQLKYDISQVLIEIFQPNSILLRGDSAIRELEGLPRIIESLHGTVPDCVELIENDIRFKTAVKEGQKTGWFYDHRINREKMKKYISGKRVLDLFSYIGAWGIQAACWGAKEVWCVDSSAPALEWLQQNAHLNNVQEKIRSIKEDVFSFLNGLRKENEHFDVIILDPPAFIKRRKDLKEGIHAYRRLNQLAAALLNPDGILISASCSLHLTRENLVDIIRTSGCRGDRFLQVIEQGHQAPDHPVHPAIPETDYLKMFISRSL